MAKNAVEPLKKCEKKVREKKPKQRGTSEPRLEARKLPFEERGGSSGPGESKNEKKTDSLQRKRSKNARINSKGKEEANPPLDDRGGGARPDLLIWVHFPKLGKIEP